MAAEGNKFSILLKATSVLAGSFLIKLLNLQSTQYL